MSSVVDEMMNRQKYSDTKLSRERQKYANMYEIPNCVMACGYDSRTASNLRLSNGIPFFSFYLYVGYNEEGVKQSVLLTLPLGVDIERDLMIPRQCALLEIFEAKLQANNPITGEVESYQKTLHRKWSRNQGTDYQESEIVGIAHVAWKTIEDKVLFRITSLENEDNILYVPNVEDTFLNVSPELLNLYRKTEVTKAKRRDRSKERDTGRGR